MNNTFIIRVIIVILSVMLLFSLLFVKPAIQKYRWSKELDSAIQESDIEMIEKLLIAPRKDINDYSGTLLGSLFEISPNRPIAEACFRSNYEIVKLLIMNSADVSYDCSEYDNLIELTVEEYNSDDYKILQLLVENNVSKSIISEPMSPLEIIASYDVNELSESTQMSRHDVEKILVDEFALILNYADAYELFELRSRIEESVSLSENQLLKDAIAKKQMLRVKWQPDITD